MSQYYYNPFIATEQQQHINGMLEKQKRVKKEKSELRRIGISMGVAIIAYLIIQTVSASLMMLVKFDGQTMYELYQKSSVMQSSFNIIFVSIFSVLFPFGMMALRYKKHYRHPAVPTKPIQAKRIFQWVCFGMAVCLAANFITQYVVEFFEKVLHLELTQGEIVSPDSPFACILNIIALSVIPPVCEELAMRCFSLQLLRKYGKGFAVFMVSIVFGLLHGNVIQFVFAFLVGMILAYTTIKTDSIVPAILIHAFNNGRSSVNDVLVYASGQKIADNVTVGIFIFWVISGVICAFFLFKNGEFKKSRNDDISILNLGQKLWAFLFPGMIPPLIMLIYITATTVKRI